MNADEAEIITAITTLKGLCDPRGHDLLDALRDVALQHCRVQRAAVAVERATRAVFACDDIDESAGLADLYRNGNGRPW